MSGTRGDLPSGPGHVEQQLLRARALIDSTVLLHRRRADGPTLSTVAGPDAVERALGRLLGGARYSLSVALTGNQDVAELVAQALARRFPHPGDLVPRQATFAPSRRPAPDGAHPPGIAVRLLCSATVAETALSSVGQLGGGQLQVRVFEGDSCEAVVADGRRALLSSATAGHRAVELDDPPVVRAVERLFGGAWSRARPLPVHLDLGPRLGTELARRVLEMLRGGHTDEVAARELSVSLRTYRRQVAEIMRELRAGSRFQAGVRAVELGLLAADGRD